MRIKINSRRMHLDLIITHRTTVPASKAFGTCLMSIRRLSRTSNLINRTICSSILITMRKGIQTARMIKSSRLSLRHSVKTYSLRINQTARHSTAHRRRIRSRRCRQSPTKAQRSHSSSYRSEYRSSFIQTNSSISKNRCSIVHS